MLALGRKSDPRRLRDCIGPRKFGRYQHAHRWSPGLTLEEIGPSSTSASLVASGADLPKSSRSWLELVESGQNGGNLQLNVARNPQNMARDWRCFGWCRPHPDVWQGRGEFGRIRPESGKRGPESRGVRPTSRPPKRDTRNGQEAGDKRRRSSFEALLTTLRRMFAPGLEI